MNPKKSKRNLKKFLNAVILLSHVFAASKSTADVKPGNFFKMIENNDVDGVALAILDGFEINKLYSDDTIRGRTPLWGAIRHAKPQMVKLLLKAGASAELKDSSDFTPLMSAIIWADVYYFPKKHSVQDKMNSMEVFDILLAHGVNVNHSGAYGGKSGTITPLGLAASLNDYALSIELTKKLLKSGADVDPDRSPEHLSPLYWALTNIFTRWEESGHENRAELIKMLLDAGADPNAVCDGHAPLLIAAAYDYDLTKILLDAGADKRAKSVEGLTPFDMAMMNS
ncbi:MAG: ankyrin repeat domain-containing protein, partial [Synergistaceae bacterium]|nr:ankyrin repeat domain-containing protein [Synergistaceae bacterium]